MDWYGLFTVLTGFGLLVVGGGIVVIAVGYCIWTFLTIDWFGIKYEDKSSPYYHDKTGKGRGQP